MPLAVCLGLVGQAAMLVAGLVLAGYLLPYGYPEGRVEGGDVPGLVFALLALVSVVTTAASYVWYRAVLQPANLRWQERGRNGG
ncbi:MAG: hypothetical protein AAFY59_00875 [Pseudomonadota bacterium]